MEMPISLSQNESNLTGWVPRVAGLALGAVLAIFLPTVGVAIAVILAIAWVVMKIRSRASSTLTLFADGYVLAILVYGVLAIIGSLTGDPASGHSAGT